MPSYLASILQQFNYYKSLGEKTFEQLDDSQLFKQPHSDSNSIAIIVNHMWGNMLSRWTDFLTTDGEKPWRERDKEFEDIIKTRDELMARWAEGWDCVFHALEQVNDNNLSASITIRNQNLTVTEAINRQLAHYAYHVGQIVYIGHLLKGDQWQSLSIPKNKSKDFNEKMGMK
ncbi:MAG: DUF1572 family protein [Flavobacteriales bacterium]|nr:DUF1572 family protein [Flavobacteriales bacterium]